MALGARTVNVLHRVIHQGLAPTVVGEFAGLVAALVLTLLMSGMLSGVSFNDRLVLGGVMVFLGMISLAASWFPARRATRIDPMVVLREE